MIISCRGEVLRRGHELVARSSVRVTNDTGRAGQQPWPRCPRARPTAARYVRGCRVIQRGVNGRDGRDEALSLGWIDVHHRPVLTGKRGVREVLDRCRRSDRQEGSPGDPLRRVQELLTDLIVQPRVRERPVDHRRRDWLTGGGSDKDPGDGRIGHHRAARRRRGHGVADTRSPEPMTSPPGTLLAIWALTGCVLHALIIRPRRRFA